MNPRIVAISGPHEGRTILLEGATFGVGRHSDNDLQVLEMEVSRHHCEIRREGDRFVLRDLGSRHGTFVNTLPIRERGLEHSDVIRVGETALLFLLDDAEQTPMPTALASDVVGRTTLKRRVQDVLYLEPRRVERALPPGAEIAAALNTLLEISTAMHVLERIDALAERLLELVMTAVPAERGSVLLLGDGDEPAPVAWRDRTEAGGKPFPVSRTVVSQVLGEGAGLLVGDIEDARLGEAESVRRAEVRSLICVPLAGHRRSFGVLYVDTSTASAGLFAEAHLELLTAAAAIASLAFETAYRLEWLESENNRLKAETLDHDIVGESAAIRKVLGLIERLAATDSTVLIRGESGTGKELAAQAIHRSSPRAAKPFVAINCATLSPTLLESELFGHEKGAFTGAVAKKIGKVEAAEGGTLFLDEVGELPPEIQAKLLRVLQEREFERLGGTRPLQVDVRVIAATNRDLETAIKEGGFREDLYYRLNVISFVMPALRDRRDDIALLARHFARLCSESMKRPVTGFAPAALRCIESYDWPGNVRQLANAVERAVVLGVDEVIQPEDLPEEVVERAGSLESDYQTVLVETKKRLILDAWNQSGGDYTAAAGILGLHVNSLHRLIRNLGIKDELER